MDQDNPLGDRRLYGMHIGIVELRDDPLGLGRVRLVIPTLYDPEPGPWAWPIGGGGGSAQQGSFIVPQKGAKVAVWFKEGDTDHPYYLAGNWGDPGGARETPTPVKTLSAAETPQVMAIEFGDYYIAIDARAGKRKLLLVHKPSGVPAGTEDTIEHDGEIMGWRIKGTATVQIVSDGQVAIDAPLITVGGRVVHAIAKGI